MAIFAQQMKKIISIFFLIIISIQCLPLKELGKCLFESSFVEEDICNNSIEKKEIKDFSKEFFTTDGNFEGMASATAVYYHQNTNLYKNPSTDLSIQPPNA